MNINIKDLDGVDLLCFSFDDFAINDEMIFIYENKKTVAIIPYKKFIITFDYEM
jgi:hypothetical protein